jgi:hypothetical protein
MAEPPCHAGSTFIAAAQTQPCFLHSIIGFVERAEHAVSYRPQMTPVFFEFLGQPFVFGHAVTFLFGFRQAC